MTTTDVVRSKALTLAEADTPMAEAVEELLDCCAEKRVPLVLARQEIDSQLQETDHPDPVVSRAVELLDRALSRIPPS